jgi:hypothetical protein
MKEGASSVCVYVSVLREVKRAALRDGGFHSRGAFVR